jgi:hypothetical protein
LFGAAPPVAGSSAEPATRRVPALPTAAPPLSTAVRAGCIPEHALLAAILADREGEGHDRFLWIMITTPTTGFVYIAAEIRFDQGMVTDCGR